MLFFNSKAKSVRELVDIIITHSTKLADGLQSSFDHDLSEKEWKFIFVETTLLFLHMVSRIGDRELNNSQNNGLFNLLAKSVAEHLVVSVENIRSRTEKETAIRAFFENLSKSETAYSICSEGFLETEPFSETALFSKFARKIVDGKNSLETEQPSSGEPSQLHEDMTKVLDLLLKLYPKLNLEHHVIKVGKSL